MLNLKDPFYRCSEYTQTAAPAAMAGSGGNEMDVTEGDSEMDHDDDTN